MKISVVTVCRNSARTIRHTLESFFAQTHADKELVVVDGASTDETLSIVASFGGGNVVVISERDRGIYDAMNKGLAAFSGDAVGFLNSDDRFKDGGTLARIAGGLEDADIVFGNLDFVEDHEKAKVIRRWRGAPFRPGAFARGWMPAHPTFYARRAVVDAVGWFDLAFPIAADYDYMLRALELNHFRSKFLDVPLIDMMVGGASTAGIRSYLNGNLQSLRSRQTWLRSGFVDAALVAKPLRKLTQFLAR
jgi:glycosyltransferase involved in cell wall biosynthesis